MKRPALAALALMLLAAPAPAQEPKAPPRNIIIFVSDGLRYGSVTRENMPNMFRVKSQGVDFTNSHSLYPTITTVNASAIATGHYIGDTGDFGNTLYVGGPMLSANGSPVPFLENNTILTEMAQKFGGNYLNETTLIAAAHAAGFGTAAIGKVGPTRIQDATAAPDGSQTLFLDDTSGHDGGFGLPGWFTRAMKMSFVGAATPAASLPDIEQEYYLMKAATRIVLPHFAESGKPFVLLFWSRDPDFTQHNAKDSVGEYEPGINGPSGLAAARNADTMLGLLLAALKEQGLDKTTDIFLTADHGFNTITHASTTSPSAHYDPVLPLVDTVSGVLATDLAATLGLPLYDPAKANARVDFSAGGKLLNGSGLLGRDPLHPDVVAAANGGSDLIYLNGADAKDTAGRIVEFLAGQDYTSGIFVNDKLGKFAGALPMSAVNLIGSARTPVPDIYVNFRTFAGTCDNPLQCTVGFGDTPLLTGQGSHGAFSRAETRNFMAAIGPDFKAGYADPAPVSNADIAPTLARLAGIDLPSKGKLKGRVIGEALVGGAAAAVSRKIIVSDPAANGQRTVLDEQAVGDARYFDAAGFEGRTVGLQTK
jgi:arylsulfatase A-like enzyme